MKQYLVFDLDGTLVDSLPGIAEGINRALSACGLPTHEPEKVRNMIGRGAANLCASAIGYADAADAPPEELERVHAAFRREYPTCWCGEQYTRAYDGMTELLEELAAAGVKLAVLSNKPHEVTEPMVRHIFPTVPFDVVMGYTPVFPRKPNPASMHHIAEKWGVKPSEITLVGDSLFDARCAENAGTSLVLVGWGYAADPAALRAWPAPVCESMLALRLELTGQEESANILV